MSWRDAKINRDAAVWELNELGAHLKGVVRELEAGRFDENDVAYQVELQHLMEHLARAWHFARMPSEQVDKLTGDEYAEISNAIPKLGAEHRLVGVWEQVV